MAIISSGLHTRRKNLVCGKQPESKKKCVKEEKLTVLSCANVYVCMTMNKLYHYAASEWDKFV